MIETRHLRKAFGTHQVLAGVDLKVEEATGPLPAPGVVAMALALMAAAIISLAGRKRPWA